MKIKTKLFAGLVATFALMPLSEGKSWCSCKHENKTLKKKVPHDIQEAFKERSVRSVGFKIYEDIGKKLKNKENIHLSLEVAYYELNKHKHYYYGVFRKENHPLGETVAMITTDSSGVSVVSAARAIGGSAKTPVNHFNLTETSSIPYLRKPVISGSEKLNFTFTIQKKSHQQFVISNIRENSLRRGKRLSNITLDHPKSCNKLIELESHLLWAIVSKL